ncbi:MAG: aminoacyl-tRNA hydrolase [Oscillospiraceae bacterium]|nr:aminoacyl-tRNA hydrolase [Oscillospiraceae bacterium]
MKLFSKFERPAKIEYIIVGLGNPGLQYEKTRHNAGFMAVDALAAKQGVRIDRLKWRALTGECAIAGKDRAHRVLLLKPQTYMNNSGQAVTAAMNFYKIPLQRVIVLFDDISLEPGVIRLRRTGSDGGQKGMRDIIELSGSQDFPRIKIGVGAKPHPDYELADWVLSKFSSDEKKLVDGAIERLTIVIPLMLDGDIEKAMGLANPRV